MLWLSADERRAIGFRSASLYERVAELNARPRAARPHGPPNRDVDRLLHRWSQIFSRGDADAFARRLAWDGLSREVVLCALEAELAESVPPAWTLWLERVLTEASDVARELAQGGIAQADWFSAGEEPPFLELGVPPLRAARAALREASADALERALPGAHRSLERQLLKEVAAFSELAFYEQFRASLATGHAAGTAPELAAPAEADARRGYQTFVLTMLRGGLSTFFATYPALARQIAIVVERWVEATSELFQRLASDHAAIAERSVGGADLGRVALIEPALSDPHNGRRRVATLRFESGLRLVYKPRDVGLEQAFNLFLSWANSRGLEPRQRVLDVLERPGYGWVEFAAQESFRSREEVRRYYNKSGGLMCLTHVFRGRDLHMENLVATREGPVLVDLELLLQPESRSSAVLNQVAREPGDRPHAGESCLATGLLTLVETGPEGQVYDMGGLRGQGGGPASIPLRAWKHQGQDSLHFVEETTFRTRADNRVILDGVPQRPDDYRDDILAGFAETYRFLMAHREEILAPGGALSAFARRWARVIVRPSNQYAMLSYVLAAPRYQRDGIERSCAMDVLHRAFSGSTSRPAVWPLLVEERRMLEGLDIPRFSVRTDETVVRSGDTPVVQDYFARPGLTAVRERIRDLCDEDLRLQLDFLTTALPQAVDSRFHSALVLPPPSGGGTFEDPSPEILVSHALWIGRELLSRAAVGEEGLTWTLARSARPEPDVRRHHLYAGSVGTGLFLAALAAVTRDSQWADAARACLRSVRAFFDRPDVDARLANEGLGACSGLGSIAYGLTVTARLLGDGSLVDLALRVARFISQERIEADHSLDVVGGSAGAILALLPLYREVGDARLLDLAVLCGERLLATQVRVEEGSAWPSLDGRLFTGLAHGTAGVGYALLRLFKETGARALLDTARRAQHFERRLFSAASGNWPIAGPGGGGPGSEGLAMTAWCHGAPGIALAKAFALDILPQEAMLSEIEAALRTTADAPRHQADHVCCGNLGRCEALFTAGHRVSAPWAVAAARRIAAHVTEQAAKRGHFRLSAGGFEYLVFDPGFFRGLSGIGYQLLRMAAPSSLPSVLAFEAGPSLTAGGV